MCLRELSGLCALHVEASSYSCAHASSNVGSRGTLLAFLWALLPLSTSSYFFLARLRFAPLRRVWSGRYVRQWAFGFRAYAFWRVLFWLVAWGAVVCMAGPRRNFSCPATRTHTHTQATWFVSVVPIFPKNIEANYVFFLCATLQQPTFSL